MANLTIILFYTVAAALALFISFEGFSLLALVAIVALTIFVADLSSGVIHMILDYFPLPRDKGLAELYRLRLSGVTPEFRRLSAQVLPKLSFFQVHAFRAKIHHSFVHSMRNKTYVKTCIDGVAFAAVPLAISAILYAMGNREYIIQTPLILGAVLLINAQFLHAYAHLTPKFGARMLRFMLVLQRFGITNSARGHVLHHKKVDQKFCMITGWANILVDPLFRLLIAAKVLKRGDALLDGLLRNATR